MAGFLKSQISASITLLFKRVDNWQKMVARVCLYLSVGIKWLLATFLKGGSNLWPPNCNFENPATIIVILDKVQQPLYSLPSSSF